MDNASLVGPDIRYGSEVVRVLDENNFVVTAAFWYLDPESGEWRLILATPVVDQLGPRAAYKTIQPLLAKVPDVRQSSVSGIVLVGTDDPLVRLLRTVVRTGSEDIASIHFRGNVINNVLIEDAFIYRVT